MVVRCRAGVTLFACLLVWANRCGAADDPYWDLVHDRAVVAELKLTPAQRTAWFKVLDPLDLQVFRLRSKAAAEATPALTKAVDDARAGLQGVLQPSQQARLEAIRVRVLGARASPMSKWRSN